jgi:hypothetical protein
MFYKFTSIPKSDPIWKKVTISILLKILNIIGTTEPIFHKNIGTKTIILETIFKY